MQTDYILMGAANAVAAESNKSLNGVALPLGVIIAFQALLSITIPVLLFLSYSAYATKLGVPVELGCHGPSISLSMLSGVLMIIFLRSNRSRS